MRDLINQWDDTQLRQLELELKGLEKNYAQLKDLMGQMKAKIPKCPDYDGHSACLRVKITGQYR